jgi:radical SAM superfamily enzyme
MEYMNPGCVMLRLVSDAYKEYLVAPEWINDKNKVIEGINSEFKRRGTRPGIKYQA